MMTLRRFLIGLLFLFSVFSLRAQSKFSDNEKSLGTLFESLKKASTDSVKQEISLRIMHGLKSTLKKKGSFNYPFNSLQNLGKITSSDQTLRVYSWNCVFENGDYCYYALIQKKNGRKYDLYELRHDLEQEDSMVKKLSSSKWLGALYYQIVPFKYKNRNLYLLLGWDGNKGRTSKKVIETLGFSKSGDPVLGFQVINWRGKRLSRVIFEYSDQAQMKLKYHKKTNTLVFDHLSPSEPRYINQFEYYGPDFSYDALEFKDGFWNLVEEFDTKSL